MSRDRGFSLLELVVVLAIFALVALIGTKVIQSTLVADQRLRTISAENADLAYGLALLRADLKSAIPVAFYRPGGRAEPALDAVPRGTEFSLSVTMADPAGGDGQGRVTWRLASAGQLVRQVWPTLAPGDPRVAAPEVPVLDGVRGIEFDSFRTGQGWRPGFTRDPDGPDLPEAVRVRLRTDRVEGLEVTVALR
jgi:general secretion pathway protein J